MKSVKKRKGCFTAIIIAIIAIVILFIIFIFVSSNVKSYDEFDFSSLNLSGVEDGTYNGSEDGGLVNVIVDVSVKNHVITDISIVKHDCGKGQPAEVIIADIIEKNSLDVDTISGATLSSNVIKAAIYNALNENIK